MAAASRTGCASRSKCSMRCGGVPGRPAGHHARFGDRLGRRRLGHRADGRVRAGAGGARLRGHPCVERRPRSAPENSRRTELPGAACPRGQAGPSNMPVIAVGLITGVRTGRGDRRHWRRRHGRARPRHPLRSALAVARGRRARGPGQGAAAISALAATAASRLVRLGGIG